MSDGFYFDFPEAIIMPPTPAEAPAAPAAEVAAPAVEPAPEPWFPPDSFQAPASAWQPAAELSYGELPWQDQPVVYGGAPEGYAAAPVEPAPVAAGPAAAPDLDPGTQAALNGLADPGLRGEIAAALAAGGPTAATAATILRQLADPDGHVDQVFDHSCVAATTQKILAQTDPAGYFHLAMRLAAGGSAPVRSGQLAEVSEANRAWIAANAGDPETSLNMLVQAALTELGNGGDAFDASRDASFAADGSLTAHGLHYQQALELNTAVLGLNTLDGSWFTARLAERAGGPADPADPAVAGGLLAEFAAQNQPGLMVPMLTPEGAHMVMLQGVDLASGQVTILDGYGQQRAMPLAEFLPRFLQGRAGGDDLGTLGSAATQRTATRSR